MNKFNFIKTHERILDDALNRFQKNELQPNEYMGFYTPQFTSHGDFLENVILSQQNWLDGLLKVEYECSKELVSEDFTHKAHFYQCVMDECQLYITVHEKDDAYFCHYVFKGEEAAREKCFRGIETMIDDIFWKIHNGLP